MVCQQQIASDNRSFIPEANKYLDISKKSQNICLTYDAKIDNTKITLNTEPRFDDHSSSSNVKKNEIVKQYPQNVSSSNKDTQPLLDYYPINYPKLSAVDNMNKSKMNPAEVRFYFPLIWYNICHQNLTSNI